MNCTVSGATKPAVVLSAELILILTITVLGVIVGLATLQNAIVNEFQGVSAAFASLNQSYAFTGFRGCPKFFGRTSWTAGSFFIDTFGTCVGAVTTTGVCDIWGFGGGYGGAYAVGGGGMVGCPVVGGAPVVSGPTVACPTCVPETTTQPCIDCPTDGTAIPARPEIPQGPAPQNLPQQ